MPIITVQLIHGRPPELKRKLMQNLAETAMATLGVPEQSVRVILSEVSADHWGIGTKTKAEIDGAAK